MLMSERSLIMNGQDRRYKAERVINSFCVTHETKQKSFLSTNTTTVWLVVYQSSLRVGSKRCFLTTKAAINTTRKEMAKLFFKYFVYYYYYNNSKTQ